MNELTSSITDLKTKVEKLVTLHKQLKKDNERIVADNIILLETIDEQKITIENLQKNNKELTTNKNTEQQTIITDTKVKINELVQEIDECIALLK